MTKIKKNEKNRKNITFVTKIDFFLTFLKKKKSNFLEKLKKTIFLVKKRKKLTI